MQAHLFGEPELKPSLSQWFTPPWLALRMARWVSRTARVLEPSCGGGALIDGLLRAGHAPELITGVDIDPAWTVHCSSLWPDVRVWTGYFESLPLPSFDVVVMNPPFEDNQHLRSVLRALELAPTVIGLFPASFEFSGARDRLLWATKGIVARRARLPERVDYGGDQSPSFDSVVLKIQRREQPRLVDSVELVVEEVWKP